MNEPRLWRVSVKETTNVLKDTVRLANGAYWEIGKATEVLIVAPSVADVERIIGVTNIDHIRAEGVCLVLGLNEPKGGKKTVEIGDMPKDVAKVLLQSFEEPVTKLYVDATNKGLSGPGSVAPTHTLNVLGLPCTGCGGSGTISVDVEGGEPIKCTACGGKGRYEQRS